MKEDLLKTNREIESLLDEEKKGKQVELTHFSNLLLKSSHLARELGMKEIWEKGNFTAYDSLSAEQLLKEIERREERMDFLKQEIEVFKTEISACEWAINEMKNAISRKG